MFKIGHAQHGVVVPRGVRLPKTPANKLKLNLFEFLQRVQQRFNKVKGNKISQLFCLQNDRDNHWVIVTQSVGYDCNATVIGSMGVARRANIKNQQLTTASTFHYVGAVALYIYPPDLPRGIFNIIANKCKLTPLFDTSRRNNISTVQRVKKCFYNSQNKMNSSQNNRKAICII